MKTDLLTTPPLLATLTTKDGKRTFVIENQPYQELSSLGNTTTNHTFLVQGPEKKAVIKSLHECLNETANPQDRTKVLELFQREATVLSRLQHPQIPTLYQTFQTTENNITKFYLMQQHFDAQNLETILRERTKLPIQEAISIILSAMKPLEYLHNQQPAIIHRDVKPANILWNGIEAKLVDLGSVNKPDADSFNLGSSTIAGTKGYMAPEQMIGLSSPQSDIYSFGATLLRLVSGVNIETLYDDKAQSFEKRFAIQYKPQLGKTLDAHLQTILDTCLKFNPEERYTSLAELRTALEQYLDTPIKPKTKKKEKGDNNSQSSLNNTVNRGIILSILGVIGFIAVDGYKDYKHKHTLSENEVAVLIDERGTIVEDKICKYKPGIETRHVDHTIVEYSSPAKLAIPYTITKTTRTTNLSYPVYMTIDYEITDPANIHSIMDMYDRICKWSDGTPMENWNGTPLQYPNPEKLTLYLTDFIEQEANNYLKSHYDIEPKPTSLMEIDPFTAHIKHAFETKLPKGLEYRGFEWTKGLPQPLKKE